jgi:hypothetical protein
MNQKGHASDYITSAPESGTIRDDTSGNAPSDRGINLGQCSGDAGKQQEKDDPAVASEER